MAIQVGDTVNYLPAEINSKQIDPKRGFSYVYGWLTGGRKRVPGKPDEAEVIELDFEETRLKLSHIRRQSPERAANELAKLVMLRPNFFWSAKVTAIEEDERGIVRRVNLDITDPTTGTTLHCDSVPVDGGATSPHTCHETS